MSCKVSVIIPLYNNEKHIRKTINSIIGQTSPGLEIELIIIDDCSSDNSYSIALTYADQKKATVLKTEQNSGSASRPRNVGLKHAHGDYIIFVDSDDVMRPESISKMVQLMEKQHVDLVDCAYEEVIGRKHQGLQKRYQTAEEGLYDLNEQLDRWFPLSHPIFTKLFKAEIIRSCKLTFDENLRNGEDSLFLFEYMANCDKAWHSNEIVYEYHVREDSVSHDYSDRYHLSFFDTYGVMEKQADTEIKQKYFDLFLLYTLFPNLDILCDNADRSEIADDIAEQYYYWIKKHLSVFDGESTHPLRTILLKDVKNDDWDSFLSDFYAVHSIYQERRELLEEIYSSRGWKLLTAVNRVIGRQ